MKYVIILTIIISAMFTAASGGDRGYGFHMLEDPLNPRDIAMGTAGTALGGPGFRYYNPARPFFTESPYITVEFGGLPGGLYRGGFETAMMNAFMFSALNVYSSSVDFQTTDERGPGFDASMTTTIGATTFGFIRDNFSVAIALTAIEDRIWLDDYSAFALSGGLGYKLLDDKLNVGAAGFHGIARSTGFGASDSAANVWRDGRVPRMARGGAAWIDTLKSIPYTVAADVVYRDEDGTFSVPVGLEVKILPILDLRIGKRFNWETEIMSFGIGLNVDPISFDAAFVPAVFGDDYDMRWSMSFTYKLGGSEKRANKKMKFPPAKITASEDEEDDEEEEVDSDVEVEVEVDGDGEVESESDTGDDAADVNADVSDAAADEVSEVDVGVDGIDSVDDGGDVVGDAEQTQDDAKASDDDTPEDVKENAADTEVIVNEEKSDEQSE